MENASKALLIAGAVLIVILLIAFGMSIFNSTTGTSDSLKGAMSATEIATFNNKFTAYVGAVRSASQAKALANVVIAHNANATDGKKVTLNVNGTDYDTAGTITSAVAALSGNVRIEVEDNNDDGLIDTITVTTL